MFYFSFYLNVVDIIGGPPMVVVVLLLPSLLALFTEFIYCVHTQYEKRQVFEFAFGV